MKLRHLAAIGLAGTLGLAACGSSSDDSGSGATTAAPSPETNAPAATDAAAGTTIRLWLNGEDTKQELVDYAIAEFEKLHPGVNVEFERQQWTGIVEKLTTALSSSDSPDVVELGNTQAQAFEAAGALADLTDKKEDLGGDDLLQSLVEAGTYDGRFYGVPYYAGARIVVYRTDLFEQSGLEVPTTLEEFVDAGIKLKQDNAATPNFSGIYFPGKYWYAALPFIWQEGGDIAVQEDGEWKGMLASPGSVKGLETVKKIMDQASGAPKDGDEAKDYVAFCNGEVGMLMGPGWKLGQILNEKDGCPAMADKIGAFALPGAAAGIDRARLPRRLEPGHLGQQREPGPGLDLLKIMVGEGYQTQFAAGRHHPGAEVAARTGQRRRRGEGPGRGGA